MDKEIKTGGPAYPGQWLDFQPGTGYQIVREQWEGMTLRDYFAAKAMQATIVNNRFESFTYADRAKYAYMMADAMLVEREKEHEKTIQNKLYCCMV